MMNNEAGKKQSDTDAELTVKHYLSIGHQARVSTKQEDLEKKFDLVVDGQKIDLKRFFTFYCEIMKLQLPENEADFVWMVVDGDVHKTYKIKKQALIDACAEILNPHELGDPDAVPVANKNRARGIRYAIGKSGDRLAYFDINVLDEKDYQTIDMFWLK